MIFADRFCINHAIVCIILRRKAKYLLDQNKTMGSYAGHVLPGSFFIGFGLWWWFNILAKIAKAQAKFLKHRSSALRSRTKNFDFELDFESTLWLKVPVPRLRDFPVEPCLKVIATTVGIIAELTKGEWSLIDHEGHFSHLNNFAHATMFCIFLLAAVVEILRFYGILFLPPTTDHVLSSMAFFLVGEVFYYHIEGRNVLDQKLHILLCTVAFSITVIILLEAWQRRSFILFMVRTFLVVLLGTWFIQIAYVLYGSHPWRDIGSNRAFVVIVFSWHILGVLAIFLSSLVVIGCVVFAFTKVATRWSPPETNELHSLINADQANEDTA